MICLRCLWAFLFFFFPKSKAKRPDIPHNGFWNLLPSFTFFIVSFIFNCRRLCCLRFPLKGKGEIRKQFEEKTELNYGYVNYLMDWWPVWSLMLGLLFIGDLGSAQLFSTQRKCKAQRVFACREQAPSRCSAANTNQLHCKHARPSHWRRGFRKANRTPLSHRLKYSVLSVLKLL